MNIDYIINKIISEVTLARICFDYNTIKKKRK